MNYVQFIKKGKLMGIKKLICIAGNGTSAQKAGSIATLYGNSDSLKIKNQFNMYLESTFKLKKSCRYLPGIEPTTSCMRGERLNLCAITTSPSNKHGIQSNHLSTCHFYMTSRVIVK